MLDKNDKKYIIRRIITYIAIAMIMFVISSCQAHAIEYSTGTIGINLYRLSQGNSVLCNSSDGNCNNITINTVGKTYGAIYFYNRSYFGMSNVIVEFNGIIDGIGPNISFMVNGITDGSGNYIGSCNTTTSSNGNTVSWNSKCHISSPLGQGNYSNILSFTFGDNVKLSGHTINIYLNDNYILYDAEDIASVSNAINNVNNSLNDSTPPSGTEISGSSSEWNSYNSDNGVINNLVLMPVTLLNSFVNGMNNSCSSYDLGELWGEHIILPCINLSDMLGTVWSIIDIILSGVFIFVFGKQCVKIFNDFTNLRSGQIDTLYGGGN